jgi:hypothetical protein
LQAAYRSISTASCCRYKIIFLREFLHIFPLNFPYIFLYILPHAPFFHNTTQRNVSNWEVWRRKTKTAHHVRRHNSQYLVPLGSLDRLEMKELRGRLFLYKGNCTLSHNYGAISIVLTTPVLTPSFFLFLVYMRRFQIVTLRRFLWKRAGIEWFIVLLGLWSWWCEVEF